MEERNFDLPIITVIVVVEKYLSARWKNIFQLYLSGIFNDVISVDRLFVSLICDEPVSSISFRFKTEHVAILPIKKDLECVVEFHEGTIIGDQEPSPDHGIFRAKQFKIKFIDHFLSPEVRVIRLFFDI